MSKPAYNFLNHTFTSFSSTGQKVLQLCPSLAELLPLYMSQSGPCLPVFYIYFSVQPSYHTEHHFFAGEQSEPVYQGTEPARAR